MPLAAFGRMIVQDINGRNAPDAAYLRVRSFRDTGELNATVKATSAMGEVSATENGSNSSGVAAASRSTDATKATTTVPWVTAAGAEATGRAASAAEKPVIIARR